MEQKQILEEIDPEIMDRLATRREAIKKGAGASAAVMAGLKMASVPIALAVLTKDVFGQAPTVVIDALNFALTLEHLESEFYKAALGTATGTGAAAQNAAFAPVRTQVNANAKAKATLEQISQHEIAHVNFLTTTIQSLGGTPVSFTPASFDFTGGNGNGNGPFLTATTDVNVLLQAAQVFEDTGVRAYKGQAGNLMSRNEILEAALRIHSVEARHAAQIRRLRGVKSWITGNRSDITNLPAATLAAIQLSYNGEDNKFHAGKDVTGLGANNGGDDAVTAAFDEILTKEAVIFIVKDFIIGNNP